MFTLRQAWLADLTHLIDSVSISYVFIMSIKSSCTPKPLHSGFQSQYQRRLVYLFACTWKCVFQMVPTCPGLFPPDPSRTAWKWQLLANVKIFSIRIQTNMFCFAWHKMFFMLNKFEMWWKLKIQKPTMHFLTLWQASPQFLGVRANTVGRVIATTKRRLLSCMIGYFFLFCVLSLEQGRCSLHSYQHSLHEVGRRVFEEMGGALASRTLTAQLLWQRP